MSNTSQMLAKARKVLFYVLPVLLIYVILRRVDFGALVDNLQNTHVPLILLGICFRPMQIILGASRWRLMSNHYTGVRLPSSYMIRQYWTGLGIGYFTPGNIGWDAYRVMVIGKKLNSYTASLITIVAEKLLGLISVLFMCLTTFPIIVDKMVGETDLYKLFYAIGMAALASGGIVLFILIRFDLLLHIDNARARLTRILVKKLLPTNLEGVYGKVASDYTKSSAIFSIMRRPWLFMRIFALSLGILIVAAICSQLIFRGLGYDLDFTINLFAAPVFFLLFLVPISFGSIGVREGAFILLYGLFGVPLETALLVSFFNLFGLFLNNIIGAIFIWFSK